MVHRISKEQILLMASSNKKTKENLVWFREWYCRVPKIHYTWIFGRDLLSQIIFILNREVYFKQSNTMDCHEDKKWKFACEGGQPDAYWKYPKNKDIQHYKMQGILTWETWHLKRSYTEKGAAFGYNKTNKCSHGKARSHKLQKNNHQEGWKGN